MFGGQRRGLRSRQSTHILESMVKRLRSSSAFITLFDKFISNGWGTIVKVVMLPRRLASWLGALMAVFLFMGLVPPAHAAASSVGTNLTASSLGSIEGQVSAPAGASVSRVIVTVRSGDGDSVDEVPVDNAGRYVVTELPAGNYKLEFADRAGRLVDRWYKNATDEETADTIRVAAGKASIADTVRLTVGLTISGTVRMPAGFDHLKLRVEARNVDTWDSKYADVAANGSYTIGGLRDGEAYEVWLEAEDNSVVEEYYSPTGDDRPGYVVLSGDSLPGVDFTAVPASVITGVISVPSGFAGSELSVEAYLLDDDGEPSYYRAASDWVSVGGKQATFRLGGLTAGTYQITATSEDQNLLPATRTIKAAAGSNAEVALAMSAGGTITGTISVPVGASLDELSFGVYPVASEDRVGRGRLEDGNKFVVDQLPTGTYELQILPGNREMVAQWYDGSEERGGAREIKVVAGAAPNPIQVRMTKGLTISGIVSAPKGVDLSRLIVRVEGAHDDLDYWTPVAADGTYEAGGLTKGDYKVAVGSTDGSIVDQRYVNPQEPAKDTISVGGSSLAGIDFRVTKAARIIGKIILPNEVVPQDYYVYAYDESGRDIATGPVGGNGTFTIGGLKGGKYTVQAVDHYGEMAPVWYPAANSGAGATAIELAGGTDRSIEITMLQLASTISGHVSGPDGSYARVDVLDSVGHVVQSGQASANGQYKVKGLASGTYKVAFNRSSGYTSEAQFYKDKPESAGISNADSVKVGAGTAVAGIDATITAGGTIKGRLTDKNGHALTGITVVAYNDVTGLTARSARTGDDGSFAIKGVTNGEYYVQANPRSHQGLTPLWLGNSLTEEGSRTIASKRTGSIDLGKLSYADAVGTTARIEPGTVTVAGISKVGGTLTVQPGTWGPAPVNLGFQWFRDGKAIVNATKQAYVLAADDAGATITVAVTGTKERFAATVVTSQVAKKVELAEFATTPTPVLRGGAVVGQKLTVEPGGWSPTPVGLDFTWLRNGTVIAGAAGAEYLLTPADVGARVSVRATASRPGHATKFMQSAETSAVQAGKLTSAPTPTVGGSAVVGSTLSARAGTWAPSGVVLSYQWLSDGVAVRGATKSTYAVASSDVGKQLSVTVTGKKSGYGTVSKTSVKTAKVAAPAPKKLTSAPTPTVGGSAVVGSTLSAKVGTWAPSGVVLSYQWLSDGVAVRGATKSTYAVASSDVGKQISVTVTGKKSGYGTVSKTSVKTAKVAAPAPKKLTSAPTPTVGGSAVVGSTLSAKVGTWAPSRVSLSYQWLRDGKTIKGATKSSYKVTKADKGKRLSVKVTGKKSGYASIAKISAKTSKVVLTLTSTPTPKIKGTTTVGKKLTVSAGTWKPSKVTLSYQWLRDGKTIKGATKSSYKVTKADKGKRLSVKVAGKKSGYASIAKTSAKTRAAN